MKWAVAVLLGCSVAALWWSGAFTYLSDMEWVRTEIRAAGIWGPALYILALVVTFPVFMCGPLIWLSGTVWPLPLAILYTIIGASIAGSVFFWAARWMGQSWADKHIPDKLRKYENKLEQYPARTILVIRTLLWINPAVDVLAGVTKIGFLTYLAGTALGLLPQTAINVVVAKLGIEYFSNQSAWLLVLLAGAVALIAGVLLVLRWRKNLAN